MVCADKAAVKRKAQQIRENMVRRIPEQLLPDLWSLAAKITAALSIIRPLCTPCGPGCEDGRSPEIREQLSPRRPPRRNIPLKLDRTSGIFLQNFCCPVSSRMSFVCSGIG